MLTMLHMCVGLQCSANCDKPPTFNKYNFFLCLSSKWISASFLHCHHCFKLLVLERSLKSPLILCLKGVGTTVNISALWVSTLSIGSSHKILFSFHKICYNMYIKIVSFFSECKSQPHFVSSRQTIMSHCHSCQNGQCQATLNSAIKKDLLYYKRILVCD